MAAISDFLEGDLISSLFRTKTVSARANSTAYAVGDRIMLGTADLNVYECITAGSTAASPPAYNTALGADTTDGTAVFKSLRVGVPKRPLYFALFTAAPSDSGGGTEVSGGSYARAQLDPTDANWNAASGGNGLTDNAAVITFPAPTANWGVVTHVGVFDRATGGNLLFHGALTTSKTINNGDAAPTFPAGSFDLTWA